MLGQQRASLPMFRRRNRVHHANGACWGQLVYFADLTLWATYVQPGAAWALLAKPLLTLRLKKPRPDFRTLKAVTRRLVLCDS